MVSHPVYIPRIIGVNNTIGIKKNRNTDSKNLDSKLSDSKFCFRFLRINTNKKTKDNIEK